MTACSDGGEVESRPDGVVESRCAALSPFPFPQAAWRRVAASSVVSQHSAAVFNLILAGPCDKLQPYKLVRAWHQMHINGVLSLPAGSSRHSRRLLLRNL